jgi:putative DNA primase/helicase
LTVGKHDSLIVFWAEGAGRNLAKADNKTGSWADLRRRLSAVSRTREKFKVYMKMSKDEQLRLKSIDGWISGAQCEGKWRNLRNVKPRNLMTLDLDYPDKTLRDMVEIGATPISHLEFFLLTTRSHSPEAPRYRMVLPMSRMVKPDEYGPLVRILSFIFDNETQPMKQVDVVSSRRAQMMFYPTTSVDGEFWTAHNEGRVLDPDFYLDWYEENHGDWRDLAKLPLYSGEDKLRKRAEKAEDPTLKAGPVGHWCRAHDIEDVIREHLSDIYIPGDTQSGKPRYTYTGGSASNGAVVEDGGLFLYSWHGTDPVGEQLVNSWDLLRVHKFGELDEDITTDTPMGQRPSWKAMMEFAKADKGYKDQLVASRYDLAAMFDDVGDDFFEPEEPEYTESEDDDPVGDLGIPDTIAEDIADLIGGSPESFSEAASAAGARHPRVDQPGKRRTPKPQPPKDWFATQLQLDSNGILKSDIHNVSTIVHNDARLWGAICYDEFSQQIVCRRDISSKTETVPTRRVRDKIRGDRWQDIDDISIRAILGAPNGEGKTGYGLSTVSERDINAGVSLAARRNTFHPVKDYLESLEWDGIERIETLFIDYLGADDHIYHREAARMVLIASVTRIYEPGHKFDFAPVLQGPQGLRKSSFIETLYSEGWFGEMTCALSDTQKIAETIGGKWCVEFGELASFYKSDHNDAKQFMSRKVDSVRMAYDRRISDFPRQTVFWGSTNDKKYLRDPTGNRRWWPIICKVLQIDTDALAAVRDQLWAEALVAYRSMRAERPFGTLPLYLTSDESQMEAKRLQDDARTHTLPEAWTVLIQDWLEKPVTLATLATQYARAPQDLFPGLDPDKTWVVRTAFRVMDAAKHALDIGEVIHNDQMTQNLDRAVTALDGWVNERLLYPDRKNSVRRYGTQGRWKVLSGATELEHGLGYRVVDAPPEAELGSSIADQFSEDDLL